MGVLDVETELAIIRAMVAIYIVPFVLHLDRHTLDSIKVRYNINTLNLSALKYEDFIFQIMSQGEKDLQKVQNSIYQLAQKRETIQGKLNEMSISVPRTMNELQAQLTAMQTQFAELSSIVQELSAKVDAITENPF